MLSKKKIFSSLLVASLVFTALAPAAALADDGIAKNDTVITQPDANGDRGATSPTTAPTDGDLAQSDRDNTAPTTPDVTPVPPVVPTTPAEDPAPVTEPTTEPAVTEPTAEEKPAVAPQDPEVPAVNVNGQPVVTVSPVAPVITASGQTVVSTQDSQIVVANNDGSRSLVSAEAAGFTVNADGTLTGKDDSGQEVTLPKTGEASTALLSFVGSLMLLAAGLVVVKKQA